MEKNSDAILWAIGLIAVAVFTFGCQRSISEPQEKVVKAILSAQEGSGEINSKAPQFSLTSTGGATISLSSYSDKPVYLNFFTTWCPICGEEQPELNRASKAAPEVQFLGISMRESLQAVSDYVKNHNVTYPVLLDSDGGISREYFTIGQPVHFFIDSKGVIRNRATGPVRYEQLITELQKISGAVAAESLAEKEEAKVTNGVKHTIPLEDVVEVLPADRIPAIDNPKFITVAEAESWLDDDEFIVGLVLSGEAKAYPIQILTWHEIVNDEVASKAVAITFCPLCDTGIGFERRINGEAVTFGTSGKLYNNNLLLHDRKTKSLWNQLGGKAVAGELTGYRLTIVPVEMTTWARWKKLYPDTKVLSRDTGNPRPYGVDPYGGYKDTEDVLFPVTAKDSRLFGKARIQGIEFNGKYKAYDEESIRKAGLLNDEFESKKLLVVADLETSAIKIFDRNLVSAVLEFKLVNGKLFDQSGGEWQINGLSLKAVSGELKNAELQQLPSIGAFWFSWVAQHPQTELWKSSNA